MKKPLSVNSLTSTKSNCKKCQTTTPVQNGSNLVVGDFLALPFSATATHWLLNEWLGKFGASRSHKRVECGTKKATVACWGICTWPGERHTAFAAQPLKTQWRPSKRLRCVHYHPPQHRLNRPGNWRWNGLWSLCTHDLPNWRQLVGQEYVVPDYQPYFQFILAQLKRTRPRVITLDSSRRSWQS